jgi:hypothetical protein
MALENIQTYMVALLEYHERRVFELERQIRDAWSNRRKRLLQHKLVHHQGEYDRLSERLMEERERKTRTTYRRRGRVLTRHVEDDND